VAIYVNSVPNTTAVYTVELMESGVSKASATINGTDILPGYCYARFTTPYTFTTTSAGAYAVKITSTLNSGTLASATSGFWYEVTYDSTSSPASGDDIIMCGWHNGGLTAKQWDITGTSTVFGGGTGKNLGSSINRTMTAGLMVGQGGTVKLDDTADCTVEIKGSIFITRGGTFDKQAHPSDIEIVSKLIMDCDVANADYGIHLPPSNYNGSWLSDGMEVEHRAAYASGTGTAADPIVTSAAHGFKVNDELIIPGLTYSTNQSRYVISIPSATQLVVSSTLGGAEAAITNTPAVGSWIGQMTRNSIVTSKNTARGFYLYNNGTSSDDISFNYTRWEYASCVSGPNLQFTPAGNTESVGVNGMVGYRNSTNGRISWTFLGTLAQEINDCILYETLGTNYSGQSGLTLQTTSNKTVNRLLHYALPGSTANCAGLSLTSSATNNIINDSHFYGASANNGSLGYAIGIIGSHNNTFNDCTINNSRIRALYLTDGFNNKFNNCNFGTIGTNVQDVFVASSSLTTILFNNCSFGSATLLSNYLLSLDGSEFKFHKYQQTAHKHRWYTNRGYAQATGSGLEDTTVKTASSYNIKINPESSSGFIWEFTVKSIVDQITFLKAYLRKNSTMGTDDAKVELFMPGTDLTGTADAIYNATDVTDTWQDFVIGEGYSGTENTEAVIRVTATSTTAGAAIYMANFFDSTDALNSWFEAKPTKVVAPTDFTAVAGLLWSYPDTGTTSGTMGRRQVDAADNAELASIK
jgi:hypothetical protein